MNVMRNFEYKHNNKITVKTSFGKIELTYVNRDMRHAESPLSELVEEWLPDDTYPARNERAFFEAVLIDGINEKVLCLGAGIVAESAIQDVIQRHVANRVYWEIESL